MRAAKVIIAAAGVVLAAIAALADLAARGILPQGLASLVPPQATEAAPWTWKILATAAVLYAILRVAGSRGTRAAAPAEDDEPIASAEPPPEPLPRLPVPALPAPYLPHPHVQCDPFAGRFAEREALSDWLRRKRAAPVRVLTGAGGAGKSSLAWAWLQRDILDGDLPQVSPDPPDVRKACRVQPRQRPEGILWWSFDRPGASFSVFLDAALRYLSGGTVRPSSYLSSRSQKLDNLMALLREGRFLLVLDGFQREMRAFSSLKAHHEGDVRPESLEASERFCVDLHAAELLRRIVTRPVASRILMTSRLLPGELDDAAGAGDIHTEVGGLQPVDAVSFMRSFGVTGDDAHVVSACAERAFHPLALRLVAGLVRGADIGRARRSAGAAPGREHQAMVQTALDELSDDGRKLLGHVAVFRTPVNSIQVAVVKPLGRALPLRGALDDLAARGLLSHDEATDQFGMHAVVRRHAYAQLADPSRAHKKLADYYAQVPLPVQVTAIEDLLAAIERYHHLIGARRYDDACTLLREKISTPVRDRLADQQMHMRLLRGLFDEADETRPLVRKEHRGWAIHALAIAYSYSGETRRAAAVCEANLAEFRSKADRRHLLMLLGALAGVQTRMGRLTDAEGSLRRLLEVTRQLGLAGEEAVARNRLGLLLAHRGAWQEALRELDAAYELTKKTGDRQTQSICFSYYTQRALLMLDPAAALDAARKSRAFVEEVARRAEPNEHDYVRSGWLLGAAHIAAAESEKEGREQHTSDAERYLTDAMSRCRRADLVGFEPDLLLTWAKWHRLAGRSREAAEIAADAMAVALRCEYRLKEAEIHNFLSRLALEAGDRNRACLWANRAADRAKCDGPPHAYQAALDESERLLAEAGGKRPAAAAA